MNNIYTIGEVCSRFSSGKGIQAAQIKETGLYPVFGGNGIRGYTSSYNFDGECAIIGRQGSYCGNVRYFRGKAYMTEHAIIACAKSNHHTGYLAYKLSLMNLGQYQGQSAQPGLSVNTLSKIEIEMPKLPIQKKIFKCLNELIGKVNNNIQIYSELELMVKTIYNYWFLQFEFPDKNRKPYKSSGGKMVWNEELKREIPDGWEVRPLSYHLDCNKHTMGTTNKMREIAYLDTSSITKNRIEHIQRISAQEGYPSRAKRVVRENDILFSTVRPEQMHYGIIKHPCDNMVASTGFAILSAKEGCQLNDIFYLYLTSESNINALNTIANLSVSSYPSITPDDILNLKIVLPADLHCGSMMTAIRIFSSFFNQMEQLNTENNELTSLKHFLLPLLMNGQVGFKEDNNGEKL